MVQATFTVPQGNLWFRVMLFLDLIQSMIRSEWHHGRVSHPWRKTKVRNIILKCVRNIPCCWYATDPCGIWGCLMWNEDHDEFDMVEQRNKFSINTYEMALARSESGYFLHFGIINGNIPNHRQSVFPCPWAWKMLTKIDLPSEGKYAIGEVLTSMMCHNLYHSVNLRLYSIRGEYRSEE